MTGLFGGAFDPPHLGHVALAEAALAALQLDELRVLVVAEPGHKRVAAPVAARVAMAEAAFAALPRTTVERDDHAYTVDLVRSLDLHDALFLIGADEYEALETWKEPDELLRRILLGVGTRAGYAAPVSRHGDRVVFFEFESPHISSRDIRARVASGLPIDELVPPAVRRVIAARRLYRGLDGSGAAVESEQTEGR